MSDEAREAKTRASLARIYAANYDRIVARLAVIEQAIAEVQAGALGDDTRRQAEGEAHKLAGVLGTFGLQSGTDLARQIEHTLMGTEPVAPASVSTLVDLSQQLRQVLVLPPAPA